MFDLVDTLTRGTLSEVKVVLASVVAAAAIYQVLLMAVGYGALRVPVLQPRPASMAHRALGDTLVVVTLFVAFLCIAYFGLEAEESEAHVPVAIALLAVLAFKITVVRWWRRLDPLLPALGILAVLLFVATWATAAAQYLV